MKIRTIAILCALLPCGLLAQEKPSDTSDKPDKKDCIVSGVVVKEPGSLPLKKAIINLVADDQDEGRNYTVTTDGDGHFSLEKVLPGRYKLLLERTGYLPVNARKQKLETRAITLSAGQELTDLRLVMLATATILGKAVDEDGDPLPNIDVSILRKRYGKIEWEPDRSQRTNDLGEYRISALLPGRYYLVANPEPNWRAPQNAEEQAPDQQRNLHRIATYYPGTIDRNQAAPIELRAGEEIPVNFTMIPARTYAVRGRVFGLPTDKRTSVVLAAREYREMMSYAEVDKHGNFEIRGVPPGTYMALAFVDDNEGFHRTARQLIDVVSADVEDVRLSPVTSGTVQGYVVAEHLPSAPATILLMSVADDPYADFNGGDYGGQGRLKSDGTFEIKSVPAGRYSFQFIGQTGEWRDFYVRSIRLNGTAADTGFSVNGNAGPLIVALSSHAAVIKGSVVDDHDKPLSDCSVVAVPDPEYRKNRTRYGKGQTDQNGRFTIRGVAPGTYTLYAWQDLEGEPYLKEDFLKSQEPNGKSVRAERDNDPPVLLRAVLLADDAP